MATPRVLVVDDDDDLRLLCSLCLEVQGKFEVLCAGSGEEALELSAREPLDIILLDVCMPGMDGPTTLARLRSQPKTAHVPVVMMTAAGIEPLVQRSEWAGIVYKPFDVRRLGDELIRIVENEKRRRRVTEDAP